MFLGKNNHICRKDIMYQNLLRTEGEVWLKTLDVNYILQ